MDELEVEERLDENGKPLVFVSSPKFRSKFVIHKSNDGFCFLSIKMEKGRTPEVLQGKFTNLESALYLIKRHVRNSRETSVVRRDKTYEENHKSV